MPLRARQKALRRKRILRAAEQLFARRGYAATAMGDVARRARVAVGTIYNYFPSKPELVLALFERDAEAAQAAGEALLADPPRDPTRAITELFDVYLDLVVRHDRRQLRELLAAALADPGLAVAASRRDLRLLERAVALLEALSEQGALREDLHPGRAAATLYAIYASWVMAFAASETLPAAALRREVREGLALALRGMTPSERRGRRARPARRRGR